MGGTHKVSVHLNRCTYDHIGTIARIVITAVAMHTTLSRLLVWFIRETNFCTARQTFAAFTRRATKMSQRNTFIGTVIFTVKAYREVSVLRAPLRRARSLGIVT